MNGVLIVNKEEGVTSFDVIRFLRRTLHEKKMGHSGTLDPNATGVLPIFIGQATKLADALPDQTKIYRAEMTLGISTDTEDIWGTVLSEETVSVDSETVKEAVLSFIGQYDQIPPMYSAKKIGGQKLYDLARQGIEVERKAVSLKIDDIYDIEIELPKVRFSVSCSKGTYIRTLCTDIGRKLNLPACMSSLQRIRHGLFTIEEARTLKEIEEAAASECADGLLRPIESFFSDRPLIELNDDGKRALSNGNVLLRKHLFDPEAALSGEYRVHHDEGWLRAVYRYVPEEDSLVPVHMFQL